MEGAILKVEHGGVVRLAECAEAVPTLKNLRKVFKEKFGVDASHGALTYSLPGDDDQIALVNDEDVALAMRLRSWGGSPLKVVSTVAAEYDWASFVKEQPGPADEGGPFEQAAAVMLRYGVVVPVHQLKALLEALDLRPRRLVKCGLAHPQSLKKDKHEADGTADDANDDDDDDADERDGWERVGADVKALRLDDADDAIVAKVVDGAKGDANGADDDTEDDAVVASLRRKGVTLEASTVHALLRLLHVLPKRFVKLGLVPKIQHARKAYQRGGKLAAHALFKGPGAVKGWGRGLAGGRGRGGKGKGTGKGKGKGHAGKGEGRGAGGDGGWHDAHRGPAHAPECDMSSSWAPPVNARAASLHAAPHHGGHRCDY